MKTSIFKLIILAVMFHSAEALPQIEEAYTETQIIGGLIEAINAHDSSAIDEFILKYVKNEDGAAFTKRRMEHFKAITEGVDYKGIYKAENPVDNETILKVIGENYNLPRTLFLVYESSLKQSLREVDFGLYRKVDQPISEESMLQEVKVLIENLSEKDLFSGAVLIAKKDRILFSQAVGEASKRFHIENQTDTKFNLGSMNKMFTSLSIMKMVEKGQLDLDETIDSYLDKSWLPRSITKQVTIRHLLSHSSGLGSYFNPTFFGSSRDKYINLEDYKPLISNETLAFVPGERFQYSNTGMFLLGVILEKVSGKDYYRFVREEIFEPVGMENTDSYRMDHPVENLAIGYSKAENEFGYENNILKHVLRGGPAGGGFSTVEDLHNYALALTNEKIVGKPLLEMMWKDYYNTNNYGYGFKVEDYDNEKVVGHSGGFYGISADLSIFTRSGYIAIVLSNYEGGEQLAHKFTYMLLSVTE